MKNLKTSILLKRGLTKYSTKVLNKLLTRKHDFRTLTACKQCHTELTESQKTWDARWYKYNQPENIRLAFFLLGLHDILLLKTKKTANSIYEELAKSFRQEIATLLTRDPRGQT